MSCATENFVLAGSRSRLTTTKLSEWLQLCHFIDHYIADEEEFLKSILTGYKTWVQYDPPETKRQSEQGMDTHSSNIPKKINQTFNNRKSMSTVFWDQKGMLLVEFMQPETTITADSYCDTLRRLRRTIQNKRRN